MSQLKIYLFGPPRIVHDDHVTDFSLRKALALFVYLTVTRQPHSRDALAALFWAEAGQREARGNLRRTLYRITETLGKEILLLTNETIELNPQIPLSLDIETFQQYVNGLKANRGLLDTIDRATLDRLAAAADLYTDDFMAGFNLPDSPGFDEWQFFQRESLRQSLCALLDQLAAFYTRQDEYAQGLTYARRRVTLDPLDESIQRHVMQLYYWSGQQAAALRQYEECVRILKEELDAPPEDETTALFEAIRTKQLPPPGNRAKANVANNAAQSTAEPSSQTTAPTLANDPFATASPRHNLPNQPTPLIGRAKELAEVRRLLVQESTYRLLTLFGPGGIGKTRLALEVASGLVAAFPDGVWLVEFAPLTDPALVPQIVASVLGAPEAPDRPLLTTLTGYLRAKNLLLILDNCEHLIDACAELVDSLLRICPQVRILATSREAFAIAGEVTFLVPSLALPDLQQLQHGDLLAQSEAVRLFVDRARTVLPDFNVTDANAAALAHLCHRLDGIPLAIELAAARVRMLRVEQINARLDDRFRLLTGGSRTALPRHQTLQALIDWSYDLLSTAERGLITQLSVFAGGWHLEAAEVVCATSTSEEIPPSIPLDVFDLLSQLVNKSLVIAERKQGAETRYRLLETIRQYARQKLAAEGNAALVRQQHLAYFLKLVEEAEPHLRGPAQLGWLVQLEAEHDNLRTALDWALAHDVVAALRLTAALHWFWHIRGHKREGREWLARALASEQKERQEQPHASERSWARAKALYVAGFLAHMTSDLEQASELAQQSLVLFREMGRAGQSGVAFALLTLSGVAMGQNRVEQATSMMAEALALFRATENQFGIAECLSGTGRTALEQGDYEQAQALWEEHLTLRQKMGDQDGTADALGHLGTLAFWQGDYKRAELLYSEALAGFRAVGNRWAMGFTLYAMGETSQAQGNYEQAVQRLEAGLAYGRDMTDKHVMSFSLYQLGAVAWSCGDYKHAAERYEEALVLMREQGDLVGAAKVCHALGEVAWAQAQNKQAARWYEEALSVSRSLDHDPTGVAALYGLGKVARRQGDHALAGRLYSEALQQQQGRGQKSLVWRREARDLWGVPRYIEAIASLAFAQQHMELAAQLFAATSKWHEVVRFQRAPIERADRDREIAAIRAALGEDCFLTAWSEGEALTLAAALDLVR